MNLDNTVSIQPIQGIFAIVWVGSTFAMIALFIVVYAYLAWFGVLPRRVIVPSNSKRIQELRREQAPVYAL